MSSLYIPGNLFVTHCGHSMVEVSRIHELAPRDWRLDILDVIKVRAGSLECVEVTRDV